MATSGLAGEIRSSGESNDLRDPFDLAGYNQARLTELVNDAFGDPVPARAMVRFSFLVGGGKKDRQKYDPACSKHMAAALRELGFEEDRGASEDLACQGSFKHQHDTDKNTMTMHVFPRVQIIEDEDAGAAGEGALDWKRLPPEYLSTVCSLPVFKGLVAQKTPSWSQRKRLLEALKEMGTQFTELEQKLINMEPMSPDEQRLYESSSTDNLAEKVEWLQADMKAMVDAGQLTRTEVSMLREQAESKLAAVQSDLAAAQSAAGGAAPKKSGQVDAAARAADSPPREAGDGRAHQAPAQARLGDEEAARGAGKA